MSTLTSSGSATPGTVELDVPFESGAIANGPSPSTPDPDSEADSWHVNDRTRPYYNEGWNFGDYEAGCRFGCAAHDAGTRARRSRQL